MKTKKLGTALATGLLLLTMTTGSLLAEECTSVCTVTSFHPILRLVDDTNDDWQIEVVKDTDDFGITNFSTGATPLVIEQLAVSNRLYLGSGGVGIGTSVPGADLDVRAFSPEIRFSQTAGSGLIDLELFSTSFAIEGTAGANIIELDTEAPATMDIDSVGATTFFGDLAVVSSRDAKQGIEAVDGAQVLSRLAALSVHRWRYKTEGEDIVHMGPMAEDFHAAFGLGQTDKSISVVDSAGVALAAAKALAARVEALEAENGRLHAELARLRSTSRPDSRLIEIERRLALLEASRDVGLP